MAQIPPVRTENLTVQYGAFVALSSVSVDFPSGEIVGLVGPNGAGKTTLLNAISGFTPTTSGSIVLDGRDISSLDSAQRAREGVVRGFQTVRLLPRESVLTNVLVGTELLSQPGVFGQLFGLRAQQLARRRDRVAAADVLSLLGIYGRAEDSVDTLPFASRRLVEVARVLISNPSTILLDEPAAGLDQAGRRELAKVLSRVHEAHPSTMVVVEHDVELVKTLCAHAVALDSGSVLATGAPNDVFADPRVRLAYFGEVHQ